MISCEAWYREANDRELSRLFTEMQRHPSEETVLNMIRALDRSGEDWMGEGRSSSPYDVGKWDDSPQRILFEHYRQRVQSDASPEMMSRMWASWRYLPDHEFPDVPVRVARHAPEWVTVQSAEIHAWDPDPASLDAEDSVTVPWDTSLATILDLMIEGGFRDYRVSEWEGREHRVYMNESGTQWLSSGDVSDSWPLAALDISDLESNLDRIEQWVPLGR